MKQSKRWIAAALICAVCVGLLSACAAGGTATGSAVEEDNGPMTLFLSREDEWLLQLEDACTTAAEQNGYTLTVKNAKGDADRQIEQIQEASDKGQGAFLVNLADPSRAEEVIEAAGKRDIVFVNRQPTDLSLLDDTHVYVGSQEDEAGILQGHVLAEYCQSEGMSEIRYLMLTGPESLPSSQERMDAVLSALEDSGFTLTPVCDPIEADYDRDSAREQVTALLMDGLLPEGIDCVIAGDDAMALGALEAFDEAKATSTPIVIGVDGTPDALAAIQDGTMMMTAYQDAERQAEIAVQAANNLNHGYAYDQDIEISDEIDDHIFWISFQSVTSDNVAKFVSE